MVREHLRVILSRGHTSSHGIGMTVNEWRGQFREGIAAPSVGVNLVNDYSVFILPVMVVVVSDLCKFQGLYSV